MTREAHDDLATALDALEARAREVAAGPGLDTIRAGAREYAPLQIVQARLELTGPSRFVPKVRAGVDVRGDGSVEAYLGHTRRELVTLEPGETPYDALRRAIAASGSVSVEP